jgi:hypothetical protein
MYLHIAREGKDPKREQPVLEGFKSMDTSKAVSRSQNRRDTFLADLLVVFEMHLDLLKRWLSLFGSIGQFLDLVSESCGRSVWC